MFPNCNNPRNSAARYYDVYRNQTPQPISIFAFPLPEPKNERNKIKNMLKRKADTGFVTQPQNKKFRNKIPGQADGPPKILSQEHLYSKIVDVARTNKIFISPLPQDELNELINSNTNPELVDLSHIIRNHPLAKLSGMPTVLKVDNEIKQAVDSVTLPEPVYQSFLERIINDLNIAFKVEGYTNKWNLFGSYLYGLVNQHSDIDLYYDGAHDGANSLNPQVILSKMRKSLPKSKLFGKVTLIKSARVPLLKAVHWTTKKQLDISISNGLGVRNSLLLKLYLSMNPTLKYLNLYLREIFKKYDCYGPGKLTTYILFWLVAFFMQQKKLLPAVIDVRKSSTEKYEVMGWDCSLPENYSYPTPTLSLYSLVIEFFDFYKDFDFLNYVICPFLGRAFLLSDFESLRIPSDKFSVYLSRLENPEQYTFSRNVVNLQDPSDLGFNLAKQICAGYASKFKSICHCLSNSLPKNITDLGKISSLKEILPSRINFFTYRPYDLVQYSFTMIQFKSLPEHCVTKMNNDYVLDAVRKLMELVFGFEKINIVVAPSVNQVSFNDGKYNKNTATVIYFEYQSTENTLKNEFIKKIIPECEHGKEPIKAYLTSELCLERSWIRILVQTQVDFANFIRENSTQLFTFALQEVIPQS